MLSRMGPYIAVAVIAVLLTFVALLMVAGWLKAKDEHRGARLMTLGPDRSALLEQALREMAHPMPDGTLCWCAYSAGLTNRGQAVPGHAPYCAKARSVLVEPHVSAPAS